MKKKIAIFAAISILSFGVVYAATTATPGTEDDPIVTKSYVEKMISNLKEELKLSNDKEDINKKDKEELEKETISNEFKVVNLTLGQILTCEASTQVIVRKGTAKVTSPHESGLSDLTGGKDVVVDEYIEPNHLLLVPRTDGRGLIFETDAIILICGKYTIN